ncbi:mitochondrial ornithine transporter 1-like [Asterias rubens]|uniref:mitochondrial ornithine transporter 1-like n=1 Tax=Asterias rubens TaxID=7604 RepID=UPI001454FF95|nr:mitochondrial ornithine transporter 1-like [Asterias rubens]XP_033631768.1 mitochondrial ornithine transporter 1-like [Asterias rubens]
METSKEPHLPVLQEGAKSLGSDLRPLTSSSRLAATYQATVDFTAGALGGVACVLVGQPFDTVKVKLQTYPQLYPSAIKCCKQILKNEGIPGLFRGTMPAMAANVGETSVLFLCYGLCQKFVCRVSGTDSIEKLSTFQNASSGFVAGFFSSLVLCPTELVKCRLQAMTETMQTSQKHTQRVGPWQITKSIIRNDGFRGMFQGLGSTWLREMPGYFFFFGAYEISRTMLTPKGTSKDDLGPFRLMICGGMAGAGLWTAIYPIDLVKSRIQVRSATEKMPGFFRVTMDIIRKEGILKLYSGLAPCVLRSFPANAALFLMYEWSRKQMMLHRPEWAL